MIERLTPLEIKFQEAMSPVAQSAPPRVTYTPKDLQ